MNGAVHTGQELFWQDGYGAISRRLPNIQWRAAANHISFDAKSTRVILLSTDQPRP
jgi:hypothetical protein